MIGPSLGGALFDAHPRRGAVVSPMIHADYLLLGGGVASAQAATAIRQNDPEGRIVLVAGEAKKPYDRPPLSKGVLKGTMTPYDAESKADDFYEKANVDLMTGVMATGIDRQNRKVALSDGQDIGYSRLLLALGAEAKRPDFPGGDLPGVWTLRKVDDSTGLREAFEKKIRVVIVGAGYIGVEAGAAALLHGSSVTVVDPSGQVWSKFASPETGGHVQRFLEGKGATFVFKEVTGIVQGHGELIVKTEGGDLTADLVLVGVGATLNVELPKAAGLEIDPKHGVVVDGSLRSEDPHIWVAGDIAAFQDVAIGRRWHAEHYLNAKWQGLHAGRAMAYDALGNHQPEPYDRVPYFFSDILEAHMVLRGDPQGGKPARILGDLAKGEYAELYAREDGTLAMALAFSFDGDKADRLGDEFEGLIRAKPQVADVRIEV